MGKLFSDYQDLLSLKTIGDWVTRHDNYWDLVVLSAGNEDQKRWYEMQLERKLLPPGVPFRVFSDPGGVRTGDGGATLKIVDLLFQEFGEDKMER